MCDTERKRYLITPLIIGYLTRPQGDDLPVSTLHGPMSLSLFTNFCRGYSSMAAALCGAVVIGLCNSGRQRSPQA